MSVRSPTHRPVFLSQSSSIASVRCPPLWLVLDVVLLMFDGTPTRLSANGSIKPRYLQCLKRALDLVFHQHHEKRPFMSSIIYIVGLVVVVVAVLSFFGLR